MTLSPGPGGLPTVHSVPLGAHPGPGPGMPQPSLCLAADSGPKSSITSPTHLFLSLKKNSEVSPIYQPSSQHGTSCLHHDPSQHCEDARWHGRLLTLGSTSGHTMRYTHACMCRPSLPLINRAAPGRSQLGVPGPLHTCRNSLCVPGGLGRCTGRRASFWTGCWVGSRSGGCPCAAGPRSGGPCTSAARTGGACHSPRAGCCCRHRS